MVADIFYFLCFTSETTEIIENYTQATFSTPNASYFTIKALLYISVKLNDLDKLNTTKNNTTVGIT